MEDNNMKRGLKSRHISMIAIGGAIGTGLFVATGSVVSRGRTWRSYLSLFIDRNHALFFNVVYWRTCYILSCIWFV